jgi:hypothetical protein
VPGADAPAASRQALRIVSFAGKGGRCYVADDNARALDRAALVPERQLPRTTWSGCGGAVGVGELREKQRTGSHMKVRAFGGAREGAPSVNRKPGTSHFFGGAIQ